MGAIRAFGEFVIVRADKNPEVSKGGIIIPGNAEIKFTTGEVLSVGLLPDGQELEPGDTVLYGANLGMPIEFNDEKLTVLNVKQIVASITAI